MVPGDSVTRTVTVTNSGSATVRYALSTSCVNCGILWSGTSGLRLTVVRGRTSLYSGPANAVTNLDMAISLEPGQADAVSCTVQLPSDATSAYMNQTEQLGFTWTAEQQ